MPDFTLDFLPEVTDKLKFMECFERRYISTVYGREVPVISLEDLIVCKIAAGRKKDREDIRVLEEIKKARE